MHPPPSPASIPKVPLVAYGSGQQVARPAVFFSLATHALWRFKVQLCWLVIGIGVAVRCWHYLSNRSLWVDEAMLTLNITEKTFVQLLHPLDRGQAAPVGFLLVEKLAVLMLGNSEFSLRLFPLLCGVASVFLFYALGRRCLTPAATLVGLVLFVFARPLIYYSSEVKQYAGDVTVALLLYLIALPFLTWQRLTVWYAAFFGVVGVLGLVFSHPAVFVLAGIGTALAVSYLAARDWRRLGLLSVAGALWGLSFLVAYIVVLRPLSNDEFFLHAWQGSFLPLLPRSVSDLMRWIEVFYSLFSGAMGLPVPLAAIAFWVGGYVLFMEKKPLFFLLLSPLFFALLASGLQKYPFSGRLILFLAPAFFLIIAVGVAHIWEVTRQRGAMIGVTFAVVFFAFTARQGLQPYWHEEIKPLLSYFATHRQAGDVLYVYYGAADALQYYQDRYGLADGDYVVGVPARYDWNRYRDDLMQLRGHKRVWVLFSHVHRSSGVDEEELLLYFLDSLGVRLDGQKAAGASIYLYDLATLPPKRTG
jgi:hypothetical protein